MKQPFTKEEKEIMDLIVSAHNKFMDLNTKEPNHQHDSKDWVNSIHSLQNVLMGRVLMRDYPEYFNKN